MKPVTHDSNSLHFKSVLKSEAIDAGAIRNVKTTKIPPIETALTTTTPNVTKKRRSNNRSFDRVKFSVCFREIAIKLL